MKRRAPSTEPLARARFVMPERVRLVVLSGETRGATLDLAAGTYLVGKDPACDLVLDAASVSRRHLEVSFGPDGIDLLDQGSTNGTQFGGATFRSLRVGPGAELLLGNVRLRVEACESEGSPLLLGESPRMRELVALLDRLAASDASVLIGGETGTGKELAVQHLHRRSARAGKPLVVCDVGSLPASLVEAELFGHVRGAFTGADQDREGAFVAAHGGTLCLDEIGEVPREVQPRLLRALETREVRPVGADRCRTVDIRIVAATHRDLLAEVRAGNFREDLYHRLAVVEVHVPSLRDRPEDIPILVRAFLARAAAGPGSPPQVDDATMQALAAYEWPGNVRQLRNVIERAVVLAEDGSIDPKHLGLEHASTPADDEAASARLPVFHDAKEDLVRTWERDYLTRLLAQARGNLALAARRAGLDRAHLYRLLKKHGLGRP